MLRLFDKRGGAAHENPKPRSGDMSKDLESGAGGERKDAQVLEVAKLRWNCGRVGVLPDALA